MLNYVNSVLIIILLYLVLSNPLLPYQTLTLNDYKTVKNPLYKPDWKLKFSDNFTVLNPNYWAHLFPSPHYTYFESGESTGKELRLRYTRQYKYEEKGNRFHNVHSQEVWSVIHHNDSEAFMGKGYFKYGYLESRSKLARAKGMHDAFWMASFPSDYGEYQEIDMFESCNWGWAGNGTPPNQGNYGNTNKLHWGVNLHRVEKTQKRHGNKAQFYVLPHQEDSLSSQFHTWAIKWTEFGLTFLLNNREHRRMSRKEIHDMLGINDFNPMMISFCLEVDDRNDDETPYSSDYLIDYLRLYQKDKYIEDPDILRDGKKIDIIDRVCTAKSYVYTTNSHSGFDKQWSILDDDDGEIIGSSTDETVTVRFRKDKRTMNLNLRIDDRDGGIGERNIVITNKLESHFFLKEKICHNATGNFSMTAKSMKKLKGDVQGEWNIYESNELGEILSKSLQHGSGEMMTFTELLPYKFYLIKFGIWEPKCSEWSETTRSYDNSIWKSFFMEADTTLSTKYSIKATTNPGYWQSDSDHLWILYQDGKLISRSTEEFPLFSNLQYQTYYRLVHKIKNSCVDWGQADRMIYMHDQNTIIRYH